jgi:hypothetical protein
MFASPPNIRALFREVAKHRQAAIDDSRLIRFAPRTKDNAFADPDDV